MSLCDPMDYRMPGFPVVHYFPEFAQIHVHLPYWVLIKKKKKKERNSDLFQCWRKISCVILAERKHMRFQQNNILLGRDFRGNKYNFYLTIAPNPLLRYNPTAVVYTFLLQTCIITFVILKKKRTILQYFCISNIHLKNKNLNTHTCLPVKPWQIIFVFLST